MTAFRERPSYMMPARSPLSTEDEARLLRHLPRTSPRNRLLLLLALRTGLRALELSRLTVGHVADGLCPRHELVVQRRDLKGGRGLKRRAVRGRSIPLSAGVITAVSDYLSIRSQLGPVPADQSLFLGRNLQLGLQPWGINQLVRRELIAAGCTVAHMGTHSLRKTFARSIYRLSGNDLVLTQSALGHAHIETTVSYLSVTTDRINTAILALDRV